MPLASACLIRSQQALGAFYRGLSSCAGKARAVTAASRMSAVLFHNTLPHGMSYTDPGADRYEQQYRGLLANPQRQAKSPGILLQAIPGDAGVIAELVS